MAGQAHWLLLCVIIGGLISLSSCELCQVNPECSCSSSAGSRITCTPACGHYVPMFAASTVQFELLDIRGNRQITGIRDGSFTDLNLKSLKITSTGISHIGCDAFKGLKLTISKMELYDNFLTNVPNCSLAMFKSVKYLSLSKNRIASLQTDSFADLTLLETLVLSKNRVSTIHPGAFQGLNKLVTLDLSDNDIIYLEASSFMGASSLRTLRLPNNNLSALHTRAFDGLGYLEYLYMSDNQLTDLDNTVFHSKAELRYLDISNNKLTTLDSALFRPTKKLRSLYIRNNEMTHLPETLFTGLNQLYELYAEKNKLEILPKGLFQDTTNLYRLVLSENNISRVIPGTFGTSAKLSNLELQQNRLTKIEKGMFTGLSAARYVYLNHNRLSGLDTDTFINCQKISRIYLSNNAIQHLQFGSFRNLSRLYQIDLSENQIGRIKTGVFHNVSGLRSLILNNNNIRSMDETAFDEMKTSLSRLELRDNGLPSTSWTWLNIVLVNMTRLNYLDLSHNPLMTIPPDTMQFLESVYQVNLRNCSIEMAANDSLTGVRQNMDFSVNRLYGGMSVRVKHTYSSELNISSNLIKTLDIYISPSYRFRIRIVGDDNIIRDTINIWLGDNDRHFSYMNLDVEISLENNMLQKPIKLHLENKMLQLRGVLSVRLSNNSFRNITRFPVDIIGDDIWFPCNRSLLYVNNLNMSNNNISYISPGACLGVARILDLRNNRLQVLDKLMTSADSGRFRLQELYLSGNRIHQVTTDAFQGYERFYRNVDLRDNQLVSMDKFRSLLDQRTFQKLSLSGNPVKCECDIAWLRNDTVTKKLDSVRCHSPSGVARYLAWCFPLTGCPAGRPTTLDTEASIRICAEDSNIELSNLTFVVSDDMVNVSWTKSGPGVITGFKLEYQSVDNVTMADSALVHPEIHSVILSELVEHRMYNICVFALLHNANGTTALCIQMTSPTQPFCAGESLVAVLGSVSGVLALVMMSVVIIVVIRRNRLVCRSGNQPSDPPVVMSQITDSEMNTYSNTNIGAREDCVYELMKEDIYEN